MEYLLLLEAYYMENKVGLGILIDNSDKIYILYMYIYPK